MMGKTLKRKPLVEAIFELKWALEEQPTGIARDQHYRLLLARLFERLRRDYPTHEQLPIASVPDELVGGLVQHRFRKGPEQWPLVQLGPGVLTFNETAAYTWDAFRERVVTVIRDFRAAHPALPELRPNSLLLRYINAVDFDYESSDVLEFLEQRMKLRAGYPKGLFSTAAVERRPLDINWYSAFRTKRPLGRIAVRFATGYKDAQPSLVWETVVQSEGGDVRVTPAAFERWLDAAHDLAEDWFFTLIEGDLERQFQT